MDRPWPRVDVSTLMVAVAVAAVLVALRSRLGPTIVIPGAIPGGLCIAAWHALMRSRVERRRPSGQDWGEAASNSLWIAGSLMLFELAVFSITGQ
jgi:hypothetical protein